MATFKEAYDADQAGSKYGDSIDSNGDDDWLGITVTQPGGNPQVPADRHDIGITLGQLKTAIDSPNYVDRNTTPSSESALTKTEVYRATVPAGFGDGSIFTMLTLDGGGTTVTDNMQFWVDVNNGTGSVSVVNIPFTGDKTLSRYTMFTIGLAGFGLSALPPDIPQTFGLLDGAFSVNVPGGDFSAGFDIIFSVAGDDGVEAIPHSLIYSLIRGFKG